jgi:hypothetical protein
LAQGDKFEANTWLTCYFIPLHFARPLSLNVHCNQYVLVIIQHFFKWIELASLQDKSSEGVVYAF